MKQVLQDLAKGSSILADVPRPCSKPGHLVIRSSISLISVGTERMLVDFGRSSYLDKARKQPEKVKMVLDKVKTDGLLPTIEAVKSKLDQPLPMGYSNVGVVIEIGSGVKGYKLGDRVVSNGPHAEVICVPTNLCAKIPENVSDEEASFTVVGAIALQGIRLTQPTLGESIVVIGLGLIGLVTVQLLRANGCRVLGIDFDDDKLALARLYGAETVNLSSGEEPISTADSFSRGRGVDGVIITASTKSNDPVHQAATMCRQRGRITLVGVVGLDLMRSDFYEKELTFQVSCSYGPGRYDHAYEDRGNDYPIGFVRWTEQRNFEAILDSLSSKNIRISDMISQTFSIDTAPEAYDLLMNEKSALGILLEYSKDTSSTKLLQKRTLQLNSAIASTKYGQVIIGALGAGNHAGRTLLPAFKKVGAHLKTIVSSQGLSGTHVGNKLGFELNTTDSDIVFGDDSINTIVIATQHNSHAKLVVRALEAGKNVFIEKPLALNQEQLNNIDSAYQEACKQGYAPKMMIGFNRRFSPLAQKMKSLISCSSSPFSMIYTCNAGAIPSESWVQNPNLGGGRIIGEACHFIDMARFMTGSPIKGINAATMKQPEGVTDCQDTASITVTFENGSMATIHYFANGHKSFPKERIEIFQGERIFVLDNFRTLHGYGLSNFRKKKLFSQNKGQVECCSAFVNSIEKGSDNPISYAEQMEVSQACIDVMNLLNS